MDVTWNSFDGSYDPVPDPSDTVPYFIPDAKGWQKVEITNIVNSWLKGKYDNYGILLDQELATPDNHDYSIYYSKEAIEDSKIPYIEIEYKVNNFIENIKIDISDDAYIWEPIEDLNTGDKPKLYTGYVNNDWANGEKQSLLRFDISKEKEVKCETAFAFGGPNATCFSKYGFNRWGWTNGPLSPLEDDDDLYSFDIYAGAGQCDINKGTKVGKLVVDYTDSEASITYDMMSGFSLSEVHLYAGSEPLPTDQNGNETVAPGQYPVVDEDPDSPSSTYTFNNLSGDIYIVAHAVVCGAFGEKDDDEEYDENDRGDRDKDFKNRKFKRLNIFKPGRGRGRGRGRK